jgi:D-serine dehydratase
MAIRAASNYRLDLLLAPIEPLIAMKSNPSVDQAPLGKVGEEVHPLNKGLGFLEGPVSPGQIAQFNWNLLREDLALPTAVLYEQRLQHNLDWMQRFIASYGVHLAPHGKTTMAPRLFKRQLESGAWGITLATAHQTSVAYAHGVRRVLLANQLVGRQNTAIVERLLHDPDFEFYCIVDSAANVDQLGQALSGSARPLCVLVELGVPGGRTGVRGPEQLGEVLDAVARWRGKIALCGVEVYEGVLGDETSIRSFLERAVEVTKSLLKEKRFERTPAILSGAGSAWYDLVAEAFAGAHFGDSIEIVLRPGCYITHDVGAYRQAQQRILEHNPIAARMHSGLLPALHLWAYVQSVPEKHRAIVGLGKRDVAFDAGLPSPALRYRPGDAAPHPAPPHWSLTRIMDQHAFLEIDPGDSLEVGEMIAFDISHPCLTFDKWRVLPVVDPQYNVIDVVPTFF